MGWVGGEKKIGCGGARLSWPLIVGAFFRSIGANGRPPGSVRTYGVSVVGAQRLPPSAVQGTRAASASGVAWGRAGNGPVEEAV